MLALYATKILFFPQVTMSCKGDQQLNDKCYNGLYKQCYGSTEEVANTEKSQGGGAI